MTAATRPGAARALAIAALALLAAGAFEPFYLRMYAMSGPAFRARMVDVQYSKMPHLRRFFYDVRAWTKPGERIAIYPTNRLWDRGYEYLHSRALYPLTGRVVLEVVRPDDTLVPQNLLGADAIAAYHAEPKVPGFVVAQRSEDGVLLRRAR